MGSNPAGGIELRQIKSLHVANFDFLGLSSLPRLGWQNSVELPGRALTRGRKTVRVDVHRQLDRRVAKPLLYDSWVNSRGGRIVALVCRRSWNVNVLIVIPLTLISAYLLLSKPRIVAKVPA